MVFIGGWIVLPAFGVLGVELGGAVFALYIIVASAVALNSEAKAAALQQKLDKIGEDRSSPTLLATRVGSAPGKGRKVPIA